MRSQKTINRLIFPVFFYMAKRKSPDSDSVMASRPYKKARPLAPSRKRKAPDVAAQSRKRVKLSNFSVPTGSGLSNEVYHSTMALLLDELCPICKKNYEKSISGIGLRLLKAYDKNCSH